MIKHVIWATLTTLYRLGAKKAAVTHHFFRPYSPLARRNVARTVGIVALSTSDGLLVAVCSLVSAISGEYGQKRVMRDGCFFRT